MINCKCLIEKKKLKSIKKINLKGDEIDVFCYETNLMPIYLNLGFFTIFPVITN